MTRWISKGLAGVRIDEEALARAYAPLRKFTFPRPQQLLTATFNSQYLLKDGWGLTVSPYSMRECCQGPVSAREPPCEFMSWVQRSCSAYQTYCNIPVLLPPFPLSFPHCPFILGEGGTDVSFIIEHSEVTFPSTFASYYLQLTAKRTFSDQVCKRL